MYVCLLDLDVEITNGNVNKLCSGWPSASGGTDAVQRQ